jgi:hypothetical protein
MGMTKNDDPRAPRRRPSRWKITAAAVEHFKSMEVARDQCTCAPIDWAGEYWKNRGCPACDRWWAAHSKLHDELGCKPWEWPAFEYPDAGGRYLEGSEMARRWQEAFELYEDLKRAAEGTGDA